jgi:hypothetical protein
VNQPSYTALNLLLSKLGTDSTMLGNGSIGLISAPFAGNPSLGLVSQITEATYPGYARQGLGTSSVTFTGADGNQYVEFSTVRFQPTGSSTPNTIYGLFYTPGNSTTTIWSVDALSSPVGFSGSSNQLTITPRQGLNPGGNFGLNVISS